uniref:RNA-dependent RNA polymerase n=1 Tax=Angiostrongylus cantonensis TaxID=6313 RepID=A0A0K0DQ18_ANGCA
MVKLVDKLYFATHCPYGYWADQGNDGVNAVTEDSTMEVFLKDTVRKSDVDKAERSISDVVKERRFSLKYLIQCLISRGAIVKDQLLLDKSIWIMFLKIINFCYLQAREACLCALERLITMIDERKRIGSIIKLVITPSRIIYVVPETIMANRALRKYDHDGTRMIRVTFRDDDNLPMRSNKTSARLIEKTLKKYLGDGVKVAGRNFGYLGSSNSQMRDSGAYFLEKYSNMMLTEYREKNHRDPPSTWQPKIVEARHFLGRFTQIESVPKLMARLGQCFTQTRKVSALLQRENYFTGYDFIGGSDKQGKEYIFSDGVGIISKNLAIEIAKDMQLGNCVPSCFQFRFRGMKGVVVVDPILDEISSWAKRFNIEPPQMKFGSWDVKLMFRPSQIKGIRSVTINEAYETSPKEHRFCQIQLKTIVSTTIIKVG